MRNVPFMLSQFTDDDADWLAAQGERRQVPIGTLLVEQGRPIESLFVVLEGRFSLYGAAGPGAVGAGEIIGEISFVDETPPSADVVASEDSQVLAVPRAALLDRLEVEPRFAARFYRAVAVLLADRLREAGAASSGLARTDQRGADAEAHAAQAFARTMERLRQTS
jgi:CRP-like cAMP-binding protein